MNTPDAPPGVIVTTTGPIAHLCPYRDEIDDGEITITWTTGDTTLELHDLRAYLDAWETQRISHEALTAQIASDLRADVTTRFTTAGMTVVCRRGNVAFSGEPLRAKGGEGHE